MSLGLLIDFLLEATFGVAFDSLSQQFVHYRDYAAIKTMTPAQQEAFFEALLLVMLADGGFSEEEKAALRGGLGRLKEPAAAWAKVEQILGRATETLHERQTTARVDALLAQLTQPAHQRALVNFAWEYHRIDDHHVAEKMDILHHFCRVTGVFPSGVDDA